jgi:uncharacterized damage-inducible protein DinB
MSDFSFKHILLSEFGREMATARSFLERVPIERFDWVPHAKSMPLGRLAIHIAMLPGLGADVIERDSLSFDEPRQHPVIENTSDLMTLFDRNVKAARAAIEGATDEHLATPWQLQFRDKVVFKGPRVVALRALMMSHLIHHRAQLGVYLRLNDIAVPGSYGPSADEPVA